MSGDILGTRYFRRSPGHSALTEVDWPLHCTIEYGHRKHYMIPPDDIFIKASCLRPLRINHRYFNQLHNLVKRDSEPPVRMSPRYHLIGISWLPIGNLHQSICKQNLGNQKNLLKKVKYITLGKVFYHYNYRTIIRLSKFNLKIVYNFLLPCSCMSFTQEFDICLIFNANKMGKLQIPLKYLKNQDKYPKRKYLNTYLL